jgi:hypothetical protein
MSKDFFDDDLAAPGTSVPSSSSSSGAAAEAGQTAAASLSFHERQKQALPEQVSRASDEIERLRQRQEELERRRQALAEQRRRIESYEQGRRKLLEQLGRGGVMVMREGEQASRMAALCGETVSLFQRLRREIEEINPASWPEAEYDTLLTQALTRLEAAANEYRRAMDRINASPWHRAVAEGGAAAELPGIGGSAGGAVPRSFVQWLIAGFAFTLPLILLLLALALARHLGGGHPGGGR